MRSIPEDLELCQTEWDVLTNVDGETTVKDLSKSLNYSIHVVKLALFNLLEGNLVERIELPSELYVDVQQIKRIEVQLTKILGPVAVIIIDDVLAEMNLSRSTIKKSDVYAFIESVSNEITDSTKKLEFQEMMLDFMQEIGG